MSPRLTLLMYRYPSESFEKEQKHHMLTWLGGKHMILSVLFTDWSFKLWTLSFAALCLHLEMSHLAAVFLSRADFLKRQTKSFVLTLTSALISQLFLLFVFYLFPFLLSITASFLLLCYISPFIESCNNITKRSLLDHCKCSVEATWLLCWLPVKPEG